MPLLQTKYNIATLEIFGSYVRGEADGDGDSDLDLLVSFREPPTLLEFIELENFLSNTLHVMWVLMSLKMMKNCSMLLYRALEIVGEAAKKIPEAIKYNYNEIPWKAISGMRDKLIHGYFGVDIEVNMEDGKRRFASVE